MTLRFDDFKLGDVRVYGDYLMTEADIIGFASFYDPQPFHIDPEAAKHTIFAGLAASGWHTCSALARMMFDEWLGDSTFIAAITCDEMRWLTPVRPGDRLRATTQVVDRSIHHILPELGAVSFVTTVSNQHGRDVMSKKGTLAFSMDSLSFDDLKRARRALMSSHRPESKPLCDRILSREGALADYFETTSVGAYTSFGSIDFSSDLIGDYAKRFYPFRPYIGTVDATEPVYAPGWQISACWTKLFIEAKKADAEDGVVLSRASPGVQNVRWHIPVIAGDIITFGIHIVAKRMTSKADRGLVTIYCEAQNQRGDCVLSFDAVVLLPTMAR